MRPRGDLDARGSKVVRVGFTALRGDIGPKIFMRRLRDSLQDQGLVRVSSVLDPRHDIGLFDSVARVAYGRPYVVRMDGVYYDGALTPAQREERNGPMREAVAGAAGCVYQSGHAQRMCEATLGVAATHSTVIHNGVPLTLFSPEGPSARSELGVGEDVRIILASAKWRPVKRLHEYLAVFDVLKRTRSDCCLVLLGDLGMHSLPGDSTLGAGEVLSCDLPRWYRAADVFLNLSYGDPCDNTVVEAIACGVPCVATSTGGSAEVIRKAGAGLVSDCEAPFRYGENTDVSRLARLDARAVAADVSAVLDDGPYFRARMRRQVVDIDAVARSYAAFISDVMAR